ncbi:MAG: MBOAT family protein [Lachnospiraceae bacterium]|nr:MBOAT family protein [Lachnospiraceae bacterium]
MQFNSYSFIFVFLPLSIVLYYLANRIKPAFGKAVLILAGAAFYSFGRLEMLPVLGISILVNFAAALVIRRSPRFRGLLLALPVIINVGLLFYFKYYNFLIQSIDDFFGRNIPLKSIILPAGISFYTFQQIAYIVAVWRNEITDIKLTDYLVYILYFPRILMGPVTEPAEFLEEINDASRKKTDPGRIAIGIRLFSAGIVKKTFLAAAFSGAVGWIYGNIVTATPMDCILLMLFYTFEIYFDFSGYSDMALGVSSMLNIDLPVNFDSPYKALSMRDFWKRWHISLTKFLTKYIYIPLGGSRKGKVLTCVNVMAVFLISGLWHGANWSFVLWGALNGAFFCLDRAFEKFEKKVFAPVRWVVTFGILNVLWLLFSSQSVALWQLILRRILSLRSLAVSEGLYELFTFTKTKYEMFVFLLAAFFICLVPENSYKTREKTTAVSLLLSAAMFVMGVLCMGTEAVFIYSGF